MSDTKVYLVVEKSPTKVVLKGAYSHKGEALHAMKLHGKYSGNVLVVHEVGIVEWAARDAAEDEVLWGCA